MRNYEKQDMKNRTGHEQISWFTKMTQKSAIACILSKMLGRIHKQKFMSTWKAYSDYQKLAWVYKEKHMANHTYSCFHQWNGSFESTIPFSVSLTGEEMAQKRKIMCSVTCSGMPWANSKIYPPAFLLGRPRFLNWIRSLENFLPHMRSSK